MQPAPHGFIDGADRRLVVAGDDQLELRDELEEVLAHEAGGDLVAAGQRLEPALGPAPALFGLDRGHEPRAAQACHVGRVPLALGRHEGVHGCVGGVVTKDRGDGVDEDRFAVGAGAVEKKQSVLDSNAGERVADHPGEVSLELGIVTGDRREELPPARAVAVRRRCRDLGHPMDTIVGKERSGPEIDHAAGGVECPEILIPLVTDGGMAAISPGEPLHRGDRARARDLGRDLGVAAACCGLAADQTREVESLERGLMLPVSASPPKPLPPGGNVAPVLGVAAGEPQRQRVLSQAAGVRPRRRSRRQQAGGRPEGRPRRRPARRRSRTTTPRGSRNVGSAWRAS